VTNVLLQRSRFMRCIMVCSHRFNLPRGCAGKMLNGAAGGAAGAQRARSSSLSMIDRSEAAWAILGNTGGYRSRSKCSCVCVSRGACVGRNHTFDRCAVHFHHDKHY
jgi:hypothetical protein